MTPKEQLREWIRESRRIVFFGGAGVSTESGIPDFRSQDGLYHQQYDYPPEIIISHSFYERNPEEFFRFYRNKMIVTGAKPNAAHLALAALRCWSCTDPSTGITVPAAINFTAFRKYWRQREFPGAAAEGSSSRMWCCMRKDSIKGSCRKPCRISAART